MDLDFSFALVSSLTPHRKAEKSNITEGLKKTTLLKTRLNLPQKSQNLEGVPRQKREEKENLIPKGQLMNKDDFLKPKENTRYSNSANTSHRRTRQSNELHDFPISMENIAVRRNRTRGRKNRESSPLRPCDNVLEICGKNDRPVQNQTQSSCATDIVNISSDTERSYDQIQSNPNDTENNRKKSDGFSDLSVRSSLEVVESSLSEAKGDLLSNSRSLRSLSAKKNKVKTRPTRTSGKSESSLSTAYDSDSFQLTRRHGTKVIPETPETDESHGESFNGKKKTSGSSFTSAAPNEAHNLSNGSVKESPKRNAKRKSSEISDIPDENKKRYSAESLYSNLRSKRKSSLSSTTSEKTKLQNESNENHPSINEKVDQTDSTVYSSVPCKPLKSSNKSKVDVKQENKSRSIDDSSALDMFKLESTLRDQVPHNDTNEHSRKTKNDQSTASGLKGASHKVKPDLNNKQKISEKESTNLKNNKQTVVHDNKTKLQKTKNKLCSPASPKMSTLVLPSEIIPKFEHINQWLKDTQEKNRTGISEKDIVLIKSKYKVSLSPRIKKKKEKAKTSLEEEQKLFEELYGADNEKRFSDDVDEVTSRTSCQESVEFSENVLDKLYGTVWQKDTAVVRSEPRNGTKKKNTKNKTPLTERKKHRTSIYEVFSSSSSEDRFEEFLENVQRGKVKTTKRRSGRPDTPEFINDSSSDDNDSLVFYQNIVSSAVKDELNNLKKDKIKAGQETHKVNRRRLSFGSSQDDGCSESGKSDKKPTSKSKKSSTQDGTKTKKSRSKKKTNTNIEVKDKDDIDVFSLVTPLKVKSKKPDLVEKVNKPEVPTSIGKSRTPKNSTKQKDRSNSEERLKNTYLRECDFKVPKSASKTFKTPSKSTKPDVPSSPALSFLSSLSELTAGLPCHPDALIYKKSFKTKREELTKRLFTLYNKEVFDNQLPADMMIQWSSRMTSTSGYCYNKRIYRDNLILRSSRIVLSTKILDRADRLRDTLIHELCHAATWIIHATSDGHGPIWRSWADKANRRFPELPVIKRCHDYAISTKFTYKCMTCGYSIGRHTKSLDTERKRCGFCYGKFQVFVTAKMATDGTSVTSGSDSVKTPRNPTGFALFVKENYAIVKKQNNVPHAQVMKLLSQKFAMVKISKQTADEPILIE